MANVFKSINFPAIGSVNQDVYTVPLGVTTIVIGGTLSNILANSISGTLGLRKQGASLSTYVVKGAQIPVGSALKPFEGNKVVLEPGDVLFAVSDTPSSLSVIISILEIS
jgi:hypothetical protein